MAIEIKVPALGESVSEAIISQWLKKEGQTVKQDETIAELETDKVTIEINAPASGVLASIKVTEGTEVKIGTIIGSISECDEKEVAEAEK